MKDRVIVICCLILVFVGGMIGVNINVSKNVIDGLSTAASIIGGFTTAFALIWAIATYYDWKKTQKNNAYDAFVELGKSASMMLDATIYLFNTMLTSNLEYEKLTDLEHRLRDGKISHSVNMFEKSIERYSDSRAVIDLLDNVDCNCTDIDSLVSEIRDWYWLLRYENIIPDFKPVQEPNNGRIVLFSAVQIPEQKTEYLKNLGIENKMTSHEFNEVFSEKIEISIKRQIAKLSSN